MLQQDYIASLGRNNIIPDTLLMRDRLFCRIEGLAFNNNF